MNSDTSNDELLRILEAKEEWDDIQQHIERIRSLIKEIKVLITKENSENDVEIIELSNMNENN